MKIQFRMASLVSVLLAATSIPVVADGLQVPPVKDETVRKECSACHMLYPAALLPAYSWRTMVDGLAEHFGDNADLDAATKQQIADYLTANAADTARGDAKVLRALKESATPARITELPWWIRKHEKRDRVAPQTLKKKGAKFKGDCIACHKDGERGIFDEDE